MHRAILVILDGLRRDLISPERTPYLHTFSRDATQFTCYRTVLPSCTRVVSASIATGCLPSRHGLAGNTMVLWEDDRLVRHDAGRPDFLQHKRSVTGRSLHVPTLAERLKDDGGVVVFNNVSPGAAYAHDPDGYGHVYHRAGSFGPGRLPVAPDDELSVTLDTDGDAAMTARFIARVVQAQHPPALGVLWMGEPDATQHLRPMGSPDHLAALRRADQNAGALIAAVDALPDRDDILLLVGSDHGHQTVASVVDTEAELVEAGLKADRESDDVVVASNGTSVLIYVHPDAAGRLVQVEAFLRTRPWAGLVLARHEFAAFGIPIEAGPAFAVSMLATAQPNAFGVAGTSIAARRVGDKDDTIGAGQHGGLGDFEQMPFLMAAGRGFETGGQRTESASVLDLAPTILSHLGKNGASMDGNPLQRNLPEGQS
ncbi:nucleotide pyrophosphatase [Neorhizobium sp. P12A]|uniref:alkaline phosphatase family protein n=1 Tax=Neorhizobium sp. P12A TaxID=2268027 RepID=UPI0011EE9814|nr:alkaline phosphatase family protein [Neorhizobium sp. P12A]KAA0688141.1 nucleotide pyrophosphatase [Neorhizobium sp. P12A]